MSKVLVTREIPELERLRPHVDMILHPHARAISRAELLAAMPGCAGLLCLLTDRVDAEVMDAASGLRVISNYAVGFDNIDVEAATARGIAVTNTPGVLTETTADLTWALLLALSRRVVEADRFARAGKFEGWEPMLFLGHDVHSKTIGIIGMGAIGQAVAKRAVGFHMRVLYLSPHAPANLPYQRCDTLDELLEQSDYVSLHTRLTHDTRHLLGAAQLRRMKPTAYLINTSRGAVVDEDALAMALHDGTIAGAALDVFEEEPRIHPRLLQADNCILAPHIASASIETRSRMARLAIQNLLDALAGKRPQHLVNPQVWGG